MSWWDGDFFFGQYSDVSRVAETYQEPCVDEDVNRECYAGEQAHPPLVAVKEKETDVVYQNMDWNTNEIFTKPQTSHRSPYTPHRPYSFPLTPPPKTIAILRRSFATSSSLRGWSRVAGATIDYNLLAELGQLETMTVIIGEDTPWSRLFEMTFAPQYRLITVKFLSTFVYRPRAPDQPQAGPHPSDVSFRLCGFAYEMCLAEFWNALGLYTEEELTMPIYTTAIHTADDAVVSAWWHQISDEPFVRAARVTRIHGPLIRYLHRVIASSITGRGMS
ncbi:hypothetical protein R6Q57_023131 [Mikania cordata]